MANEGTVLPCNEGAPLDWLMKEDGTPGKHCHSLELGMTSYPFQGAKKNHPLRLPHFLLELFFLHAQTMKMMQQMALDCDVEAATAKVFARVNVESEVEPHSASDSIISSVPHVV